LDDRTTGPGAIGAVAAIWYRQSGRYPGSSDGAIQDRGATERAVDGVRAKRELPRPGLAIT